MHHGVAVQPDQRQFRQRGEVDGWSSDEVEFFHFAALRERAEVGDAETTDVQDF